MGGWGGVLIVTSWRAAIVTRPSVDTTSEGISTKPRQQMEHACRLVSDEALATETEMHIPFLSSLFPPPPRSPSPCRCVCLPHKLARDLSAGAFVLLGQLASPRRRETKTNHTR